VGRIKSAYGAAKGFFDFGMKGFMWLDTLMRKAAVLGAYYQGIEKRGMKPGKDGGLSPEALNFAREVNREANFDYGIHDTPGMIRWARGTVIGDLAFQFKKYPIKEMEFMWNIGKKGSFGQKARLFGPFLLIAGLGQFPFSNVAASVIGALLAPFFDDGFEPEVDIPRLLGEWAGSDETRKALAQVALYGLFSQAGVDISRRAGLGDGLGQFNWFGPAFTTMQEMYRQGFVNGNAAETVKAFSPGLGSVRQGALGEARTTRGRLSHRYTPVERAVKAAGFRTMREAEYSEEMAVKDKETKRRTEKERNAIDDYIGEPTKENMRRLKELGVSYKRVNNEILRKGMTGRDRMINDLSKKERAALQR
jgi:hypothetical protein